MNTDIKYGSGSSLLPQVRDNHTYTPSEGDQPLSLKRRNVEVGTSSFERNMELPSDESLVEGQNLPLIDRDLSTIDSGPASKKRKTDDLSSNLEQVIEGPPTESSNPTALAEFFLGNPNLSSDSSHHFFFIEIKKYIDERTIKNLRSTCKAFRGSVLQFMTPLLAISSGSENIITLLMGKQSPLPFPRGLRLRLVSAKKDLLQLLDKIKNDEKLKTYIPNSRVEVMSSKDTLNDSSVALLPDTLTELKVGDIESSSIVNLEYLKSLKILKIGKLGGPLKLPFSIIHFESENCPPEGLDLRAYSQLTTVKVKIEKASGPLLLPPNVHNSGKLNFIKLHPQTTIFRSKRLGHKAHVDWNNCPLQTVEISNSLDMPYLTLPPTVTTFECTKIGNSKHRFQTIVDLRHCVNLTTVRVNISCSGSRLILPARLQGNPNLSVTVPGSAGIDWQ